MPYLDDCLALCQLRSRARARLSILAHAAHAGLEGIKLRRQRLDLAAAAGCQLAGVLQGHLRCRQLGQRFLQADDSMQKQLKSEYVQLFAAMLASCNLCC